MYLVPAPTESSSLDKNVESVVKALRERSIKGLEKYGVTTERSDITFLGWVEHAQQENMDNTIYLERLKKDAKIILAPYIDAIKASMEYWEEYYNSTYGDKIQDNDFSLEGIKYSQLSKMVEDFEK